MAKKTVEKHEKVYVHIERKSLFMFLRGLICIPLLVYLLSSLFKVVGIVEKTDAGWWTVGFFGTVAIFTVGMIIIAVVIIGYWDDC